MIEDTVVEPDQDRCVTLAVHNYNYHTVRLEKGHTLGRLQVVTRLPSPINPEKQPAEVRAETDSNRTAQLLDQLHWDPPSPTSEQEDQIKDFIILTKTCLLSINRNFVSQTLL